MCGVYTKKKAIGLYTSAIRFTLVAFMGVCAVFLPDFELITGIVGGFTGITCFVMPALCYRHFCGYKMRHVLYF